MNIAQFSPIFLQITLLIALFDEIKPNVSQKHLRPIDLENEGEADGANFARGENLELLRTLVEVVAERDCVVYREDGPRFSPTFQVDGFRRFEETEDGGEVIP